MRIEPNPALTAAGLLRVPWYVVPEDVIGGWAVANVDLPVGDQDPNLGHRALAEFVHRELAQVVVTQHNATLTDRYAVEHGSSIYMCGHGSYQVRRAGSWLTLVDLTAGPLQAWRLQNLLNGRSRDDPPWPDPAVDAR